MERDTTYLVDVFVCTCICGLVSNKEHTNIHIYIYNIYMDSDNQSTMYHKYRSDLVPLPPASSLGGRGVKVFPACTVSELRYKLYLLVLNLHV